MNQAQVRQDDSVEEAQRVFELQREHRWRIATSSADERIARLKRLEQVLIAHRSELHTAVHKDFRKHHLEVEITELQPVLIEIRHAIRHLRAWMKPRKVPTPMVLSGARSEIHFEPRGQVLILAPWNYPVQLTLSPLVAAIAAGNCVILRPSEMVPATGLALKALIREAFHESEVALLTGDVPLAEALLGLPFDHLFFTGSPRVGRIVMERAARSLATVTLELGGKSPVVVDASADVAEVAPSLAWGKLINAGQTCVAPDYVLVHASRKDALVKSLRAAIERKYGKTEEARQKSPDFARLIDRRAFRRVKGLLDDATARGAVVEVGGVTDEEDLYISPTVLSQVPEDCALMKEEIFGPLLPILTWESPEEAVAQITGRSKPLALYLLGKDAERIRYFLHHTTAGASVVNNLAIHLGNPHLPFGGIGESGQGSYHGHSGFLALSHQRAVLHQGRGGLLHLLYPPYGKGTRRTLSFMGKMIR